MKIIYHQEIEKDFKKLKRFPSPKESLESWERLFSLKGLEETHGIKAYPGFGSVKIYKARVIPLRENRGKSDGYRLIFQLMDDGAYLILLFSRHGLYNKERELINSIKERLR